MPERNLIGYLDSKLYERRGGVAHGLASLTTIPKVVGSIPTPGWSPRHFSSVVEWQTNIWYALLIEDECHLQI